MMRLARDGRGGATVEFALVAPVFLVFLFFILDGGRMVYTRQALNELATATARCAALKATGCTTTDDAESWAVARGAARANIRLNATTGAQVEAAVTCNGRANMTRATLSLPYNSTVTGLLPRKAGLSPLRAVACFPAVA